MPNLTPPVINVEKAIAYRDRILRQRPEDSDWQPLMVLYLADNTQPDEIIKAAESGLIYGKEIWFNRLIQTQHGCVLTMCHDINSAC